jgi:glycosyltransferase involved in cell wall biosynthesis
MGRCLCIDPLMGLKYLLCSMPGISVITICFNNLADLQKTCVSVDGQTRLPDEHWVVNGSSTHDIEQWLLNTPQPAYRKWLNERDEGISDAFNKGIAQAGSSITHLLNSGDVYAARDVLEAVEKIFAADPQLQWISGNIAITRGGKAVTVGKAFDKNKLYRGMRSVSHPTWFVKKEVYARVGLYDSRYKIAMDYDMMCRIADEPYQYLDKLIVRFDDTGVSSANYLKSLDENKKVFIAHFGPSAKLNAWQLRLKVLHHLLQTGFGRWLYAVKKKLGLENF